MALPIAAAGTIVGWIVAGIASSVVGTIVKTLITLGVGYVTYTGLSALLDLNYDQIMTLINTLPPTTVSILGVLKVGVCLKIWFSAFAMKVALWGINNDSLTKMRVTAGTGT
ncbi:DUF2523 domain-containing protein [Hydrogenophaga sp. ANAO-22]|uniref:DUF2523 domain-containing protein n=1 Tax=Hydrogenophaga sp. ANAO-22 TaxID=3166645 RepID=UPI0036D2741F